jgi:hypothetical protein
LITGKADILHALEVAYEEKAKRNAICQSSNKKKLI